MASDAPLRPGGPAGVRAIHEQRFRVPLEPTRSPEDVLRRIREKLSAEQIQFERMDLSDMPVRRGSLFNAVGERVAFPDGEPYRRCFVALIDPAPLARWAHRAYWAFVPAEGPGEVILVPTDWPEHSRGPVRLDPVGEAPEG